MYDTIQLINPAECLDCATHAVNKEWSAFIACSITIVSGAIIRFFEKRKLKRQNQKD